MSNNTDLAKDGHALRYASNSADGRNIVVTMLSSFVAASATSPDTDMFFIRRAGGRGLLCRSTKTDEEHDKRGPDTRSRI